MCSLSQKVFICVLVLVMSASCREHHGRGTGRPHEGPGRHGRNSTWKTIHFDSNHGEINASSSPPHHSDGRPQYPWRNYSWTSTHWGNIGFDTNSSSTHHRHGHSHHGHGRQHHHKYNNLIDMANDWTQHGPLHKHDGSRKHSHGGKRSLQARQETLLRNLRV